MSNKKTALNSRTKIGDLNIITGDEIENFFETSYSDIIQDIYHTIKENCDMADHGILRTPNSFALCDFVDLIKYNVNITKVYKKKFKIDN